MKDFVRLFEVVNKIALDEIEKFGGPSLSHYNLALKKGELIAKKLNADVDIVKIGCALMDIKLGECIKNGCQPQHIQKSYEYAKEILEQNDVDSKTKKRLLDCVESHHGVKDKYKSLEAEIVANADCYRFIHPQGVLTFIQTLTKRGLTQNGIIDGALAKLEEKHNILSLDVCKKELEPIYKKIKSFLTSAYIN